jgi:tetratricopeptide (TPR) repeat protein
LCVQIGNQIGKAISLSNKGQIFKEQKEYLQAYDVFAEAITINKQIGNKTSLVNCLIHQSDILLFLNKPEEALNNLKEAEGFNQKLNNTKNKCRIFLNQCKAYSKLNQISEIQVAKNRMIEEEKLDDRIRLEPMWKEIVEMLKN